MEDKQKHEDKTRKEEEIKRKQAILDEWIKAYPNEFNVFLEDYFES